MTTAKEALIKVEAHERECAVRYQNIEKRLDEGSLKLEELNIFFGGFMV